MKPQNYLELCENEMKDLLAFVDHKLKVDIVFYC